MDREISRLARVVPVDPQRGIRSSLAFAAAAVDQGDSLVWFPEGGISRDGKLQPFRPGIGLLLENRPSVKVIPTTIEGTFEALPPDHWIPRKRKKVVVTFGESLETNDLKKEDEEPHEQIAHALYEAVASQQENTGSENSQ